MDPVGKEKITLILKLRDFERMARYFFSNQEERIRILDEQMRMNILLGINKRYNNYVFASLSDDQFVERLSTALIVIKFKQSRYNHDYYNHKVLFGCNLRDLKQL